MNGLQPTARHQAELECLAGLFKELPEDSWDQSCGNVPQAKNRSRRSVKKALKSECCFGAKIVCALSTKYPDIVNGLEDYDDAYKGLALMFGCTEFHIYRALVEAGSTSEPFSSEAYEIPQPEVFERLIKLEKMPELSNFDFSLSSASGRGYKLRNLDFSKSHTNASFSDTEMHNVKFDDCWLSSPMFRDSKLTECSFKGALISGRLACENAVLTDCDFSNAIFAGSHQSLQWWDNARFENCNFSNALIETCLDLKTVTMINCDFSGAKMEKGTTIENKDRAVLENTNLRKIRRISQEEMEFITDAKWKVVNERHEGQEARIRKDLGLPDLPMD